MKRKIVIMGGYGDGLVVLQTIRDIERSDGSLCIAGFLNDACQAGEQIAGQPVLGKLEDWATLDEDILFVPALHKVKQMSQRQARIAGLNVAAERWASVIHPTAVIADDVSIGEGSFIGSHVTIQPAAALGSFSSVRAGANIGHDVKVGDYCYIGPNATLSGCSALDEGAHLGPNAVITDGLCLEHFSVAGAGAVIGTATAPFSIYIGNPARNVGSCAPTDSNDLSNGYP